MPVHGNARVFGLKEVTVPSLVVTEEIIELSLGLVPKEA